jgi:hypothetical protein
MNEILNYRLENSLTKRDFCTRFGLHEGNYNRDVGGKDLAIIETETADKLIEIKGEYIK